MKNSKKINHSLNSFNSYLESMNCNVFETFVSIKTININKVTKTTSTCFAAIIPTCLIGNYVVAYKYKHMNVPYIESTMHTYENCKDIVNNLLKV